VVVDPQRLLAVKLSLQDIYEALERNNALSGGGDSTPALGQSPLVTTLKDINGRVSPVLPEPDSQSLCRLMAA